MSVPYYVLAASVGSGHRVKGFFRELHDSEESPGWLLTQPEVLRPYGFDVSTGSIAQLLDSERWEIDRGRRKLLRLFQDGTLLFRMRADHEFLGWGQNASAFAALPALNPTAVVEVHSSFVQLFRKVLERLNELPSQVYFDLRFSAAKIGERRIAVTRHYPRGLMWVDTPELHPISQLNASTRVVTTSKSVLDAPYRVAAHLLATFYSLFDADASLIPFLTGDVDSREVDIDALRRI